MVEPTASHRVDLQIKPTVESEETTPMQAMVMFLERDLRCAHPFSSSHSS
jgi:hypothetical protein